MAIRIEPTGAYGRFRAVLTFPGGAQFEGWGLTERAAYQSAWRKSRQQEQTR